MGTASTNVTSTNAVANDRPAFLITIDTEGDSAWSRPKVITTRNASYLHRFQALCDSHGFKPTWLTNYEMMLAPAMQELGRDVIKRASGEIGMHLHAWNSPPVVPLTSDDFYYQPFLIEYSTEILREKVRVLTDQLEQIFSVKMLSHRAGRWSFDARYARVLADLGYMVDCSVTPTVSWSATKGDPKGQGGTDFSSFPCGAYYFSLDDIGSPGSGPILELPMTICRKPRRWASFLPLQAGRIPLLGRIAMRSSWLRPHRGNFGELLELVNHAVESRTPYIEFMLHSSEFMPGGSPTFETDEDIERLYGELDELFSEISRSFEGATLSEYAQRVQENRAPVLGCWLPHNATQDDRIRNC
jgi:hypothetical protein